jgi:cytidylate kinase
MTGAVPVIAIDGPSGSGKGTIARILAQRLGWNLLDSGALYRGLALLALERGVSLAQPAEVARLAAGLDIEFRAQNDETLTLLNGRRIDTQLRAESTGEAASQIAQYPQVRASLLSRQRAYARPNGLVADGRDIGTVIFPNAPFKFFLTASPQERARRRHKQLKQKGISVSLRDLATEIADRDRRDSDRKMAPLKPAEDAYHIDSSELDVEAVVTVILTELTRKGLEVPSDAWRS